LLIDLGLGGKEVLIVGGGEEAEFKARLLLDSGAKVTVIGDGLTPGLVKMGKSRRVKIGRSQLEVGGVRRALEELRPRVVFLSTGDDALDERLAEVARDAGALVCVRDRPRLNDFNMPAIAKVGRVRVGISTGGRSPAMASVLRKRVEELIRPEDVLQVKLQEELRRTSRDYLRTPESRKRFVYRVIGDKEIGALLKRGEYARAKRRAERLLVEAGEKGGKESKG
jgi:siroheme synthase-like protein